VSSRDRDFRPTRRRGFDDDNFGSPRRSFGSTPGSSVQRFEAPSGHPVQAAVDEPGTVKWYNAMKGFGFIASDRGGKDIFVHASTLERAGIAGLTEGQRVAVDVIDGRKGPEAAGLRLI
jgi:cold shock protein